MPTAIALNPVVVFASSSRRDRESTRHAADEEAQHRNAEREHTQPEAQNVADG
jgi:hypothetical protein